MPAQLPNATKVAACRYRNLPIFFVLISSQDFSWLKKFDLSEDSKDQQAEDSGIITASHSMDLKVLS